MRFLNNDALLEISDNIITITQGNEALTVAAPVWAAEILQADKPSIKDVDFSERSQSIIYKLLKYSEKCKPTLPKFNPVAIQCPNRKVLQFHDDGKIDLYDGFGKHVVFHHKPLVNAQIARAKGYRITQ